MDSVFGIITITLIVIFILARVKAGENKKWRIVLLVFIVILLIVECKSCLKL